MQPRICSLAVVGSASHCDAGPPAAAMSANEVPSRLRFQLPARAQGG